MNELKRHISRPERLPLALFDCFADRVDNKIQTRLVSELMAKYAEASKKLDESNKKLLDYSLHLEELVQKKTQEMTNSKIAVIHALVKLSESRDEDTGAHIERTSGYCRLLAQKAWEQGIYKGHFDTQYIENIEKASPLHDIGKVGIVDAILLKPGRLTDEEFEIMKTHVLHGYNTLSSVEKTHPTNRFVRLGMEISKYHHEKWDGSGYMGGLSGEDIPLSARIMAIADVYDALRSKRVYKDAFSHKKSVEIMAEGRKKHFDPLLVDIFFSHQEQFCQIYEANA